MSTTDNSSLWQMMAQLDASIQESNKRDADKGVVEYSDTDVVEERSYRLPLRVSQELNGAPVGFELPKPVTPP